MRALSEFSSNKLVTRVHDDASAVDSTRSIASPPRQRRRMTPQLRAQVADAYTLGHTSRQVAEELHLGRTTVLKILKEAGAKVRPQGLKY